MNKLKNARKEYNEALENFDRLVSKRDGNTRLVTELAGQTERIRAQRKELIVAQVAGEDVTAALSRNKTALDDANQQAADLNEADQVIDGELERKIFRLRKKHHVLISEIRNEAEALYTEALGRLKEEITPKLIHLVRLSLAACTGSPYSHGKNWKQVIGDCDLSLALFSDMTIPPEYDAPPLPPGIEKWRGNDAERMAYINQYPEENTDDDIAFMAFIAENPGKPAETFEEKQRRYAENPEAAALEYLAENPS